MKTCTKCKIEKPKAEFSKRAASKDGLQSSCKSCYAAYNAANSERTAKYSSDYRAANRERISKYIAENRDRILEQKKKYHAENRKRIMEYRAENHERFRERAREYVAANLNKYAEHARNRRARKRNAEGSHTAADISRIFEHQRGLCANCHTKLFKSGRKKFHADHIVPLVRGGSNLPINLQCLCPTCNLRKNAKDPFEWAKEQGRLL